MAWEFHMRNGFRCFWTSVTVLMLAGLVSAQQSFVPEKERRDREDQLKTLADNLLKTKDTHKRVELRDEMIKGDTLKSLNGLSVPFFVAIYQAGLRKDQAGQDDINARLQAVVGLSALDNANAPLELTKMMNDPSQAVRLRLLKAVHDKAIIRAWEQVVPLLNDSNVEIKIWAAKTLGKLKQGAEGKASEPLIALLVKSWRELKDLEFDQTDRRSQLNTLIEVVARSLQQLTGIDWKPPQETAQLPDSIAPYTEWWNAKFRDGLKDPRPSACRDALQAMANTADRTVAKDLVEFMAAQRQRWQAAADADKTQYLNLMIMANDMLKQVSGQDVTLSTTSSAQDVDNAVKKWTAWWTEEVKKMGAPKP